MHGRGRENSEGLVHVRPRLERVLEDESDALHHALDKDVAQEAGHSGDDGHSVGRVHPFVDSHFEGSKN